jgi:hypothetical protein
MADMTWSALTELQQWNAANLNAYFESIESGLNDLEGYAIQDYGLGYWNLDATLALTKLDGTPDPTVRIDTPFPAYYTNKYVAFDDDTISATPHASPGTNGWAVVEDGTSPTSNKLEISWSSGYALGMTQADRVAGILICAESHVRWIVVETAQLPLITAPHWPAFAIQWKDSSNVWHTVGRTERFIDPSCLRGDNANGITSKSICFPVTIRTLLLPTDVSDDVYGVRMVFTNYGVTADQAKRIYIQGITSTYSANVETKLAEGSITAFPIHAKVM